MDLRYGDSTLTCTLPESWRARELVPACLPALDDVAAEVRRAVDNPISSRPLEEILRGARNLVIVASDKTRVTGADIVLPEILNTANRAGIPDSEIAVLFGCGTHAGHTEEERRRIVGEGVASRVRLVDHNCHADDLVELGTTPAGTPVAVNRLAHQADRLVVTGTVQFHYFAGFGGGRKGVMPGICGEETIIANHAHTMRPGGGRNPHCRPGMLEGNELSEDMADAVRLVKPDFLVNVILGGDRRIAGVFAGDWENAHREACRAVADCFTVPIDEPADMVITTPGGYPKDINYIQSHKAYDNAFYAVKPDGVIILAAECREGIGSPVMKEYLALSGIEENEERLRAHFQISGHTALAHRLKAQAVHTIVVTGMNDDDAALLDIERTPNMNDALARAAAHLAVDDPRVYVMPDGYNTLPQLR